MDKVSHPSPRYLLSAFIQFDSLSSSAGHWTVGHSDQMASAQSQSQRKHSHLRLATDQVIWILVSEWSILITWPEYRSIIGSDLRLWPPAEVMAVSDARVYLRSGIVEGDVWTTLRRILCMSPFFHIFPGKLMQRNLPYQRVSSAPVIYTFFWAQLIS